MDFVAILIPVAVLGSLGLIFALGLGIASKKFAVEKVPHLDEVTELLPGANCGGCGYPGCSGLAAAVCAGKANVTACGVITRENAERVGELLGIKIEKLSERHARVLCSGGKDVSLDAYQYDGLKDCRAAVAVHGGPKLCEFGCIGLGTCASVCPFNAISITERGIAKVDTTKCTGCGKCVSVCPKHCIAIEDENNSYYIACKNINKGKAVMQVCKAGCIGCGMCARNCETGALKMVDNIPVFDHEKCVGCLTCAKKCPVKIIDRVEKEIW